MERYLEEMLVLCQRSEEYNTFMLGKMAEACAPALLGAASENAFRSGQFNVIVRELIAYYINMVLRLSLLLVPLSLLRSLPSLPCLLRYCFGKKK